MSVRRKARILGSLALLLASTIAPTQASAGAETLQSCLDAYVDVTEDVTIFGGSGDGLHICFNSALPNLANVPVQTGDHKCNPDSNSHGTFNNCISWAQFHESGVNTTVCLYYEVNYIGQLWKGTNNGDTGAFWTPPQGDSTTSIKFGC